MRSHHRRSWWYRHSLTIISTIILLLWIVLYTRSNPVTHWGSFFGNAIADWTGMVLMILATKYLFEKDSAESRQFRTILPNRVEEILREHSLSIFLVLTGAIWVWLFARMNAQGRWGQVVGNIVSEWTQVLGVVLLTKRLKEIGSKDSR